LAIRKTIKADRLKGIGEKHFAGQIEN
jgi:hypothetical protein